MRLLFYVIAIVILSVLLSVNSRYRTKPRKDRDSELSPYDSVESSFGDRITCRWMRRFPSNEGVEKGVPH